MTKNLLSLSSYQYHLPPELIAQYPCTPRDSSRLMVIDRAQGTFSEIVFRDLAGLLNAGDNLIFNDTKVIPARLFGKRTTGGEAEIFLIRSLGGNNWETMARPGKKIRAGSQVIFSDRLSCTILETLPDGNKVVRFECEGNLDSLLESHGQMPLPPYIKRENAEKEDQERYQTVYAAHLGSKAAPTAGLHFTPELLQQLRGKGISLTHITLHLGLGTFRPVQVEDIRTHPMHTEEFTISPEAAHFLNQQKGKRTICVGTTCCRALETASDANGILIPGSYSTDIFIYPGYRFRAVNTLLTNFHLPGSTLLMLVSAFAGYDLIMEAYAKAIKEKYRFYSYGDAMLIL
jgi:S-adenosylmethionine:tRNA ribosyltransferase-isomerase